MGKRRKTTAKTGDKKLYKRRELKETVERGDHDNMYSEVDRYHNQQEEEYILLNAPPKEHVDDDGYADKEAILDLAGGVSSSEEVSDESDDESEPHVDGEEEENEDSSDNADDESEDRAFSSDDDDEDDEMEEAVTDWGRRKSSYFGGDTADLELGQAEEDAYLEEDAAKEVLNARYEAMEEADFVLSDNEEDEAGKTSHKEVETFRSCRDLKKLSSASRRKFLQSNHPELIPLVSHFSDVVTDWNERTRVVVDALFCTNDVSPKDVGATKRGLEYILTKSMLQASTALNVAAYLLLKADQTKKKKDEDKLAIEVDAGSEIKSHPVLARLHQWNKLGMKFEEGVESKISDISEQIDNLAKAALLMRNIDDDEDSEGSNDEKDNEDTFFENCDDLSDVDDEVTHSETPPPGSSSDVKSTSDIAQGVLNEARFGLRHKEIGSKLAPQRIRSDPLEYGDDEEDSSKLQKVSQSLASTINAIQQRSSTKARKLGRHDEDLDQQGGDDDRVNRGIAMMEADLGPLDDNFSDGEMRDEIDDELDDGMGSSSFYDQVKRKSEARKALKKQKYAVAPKFPVMEGVVEGERAISQTILKNRGLVAHKAKINRNPRVKKREQFRKAEIRRKGAVRNVRTGEVHKYGGEATGIKTGLSKSRKLGTR